MKVLIAATLFVLAGLTPVIADQVDVYEIATDGVIDEIIPAGNHAVIRSRRSPLQSLRIRQGAFTLEPYSGVQPATPERPDGSLPDGETATGSGLIRRAWLSAPTTRYDHGVLGDGIEAGAVTAELSDGRVLTYTLPLDSVFEDRHPRIIDINTDGTDEILLVRSYLDRGAALALISPDNNRLAITAEADPIGLPHRWLNPVGAGDFDNDSIVEIAAVITPHIGGTLQLYEMKGKRLIKDRSAFGFSNHQMGSRNLGLSLVADLNGDQVPDIVVPDASRRNLLGISFRDGTYRELFRVPLNGTISAPLRSADLDGDGRHEIIFGIAPNRLMVLCLHP